MDVGFCGSKKTVLLASVGSAHTEPDYFTAHHADLALTVANQAAIALVNAELFELRS
jgi:GAF domain-containing protein